MAVDAAAQAIASEFKDAQFHRSVDGCTDHWERINSESLAERTYAFFQEVSHGASNPYLGGGLQDAVDCAAPGLLRVRAAAFLRLAGRIMLCDMLRTPGVMAAVKQALTRGLSTVKFNIGGSEIGRAQALPETSPALFLAALDKLVKSSGSGQKIGMWRLLEKDISGGNHIGKDLIVEALYRMRDLSLHKRLLASDQKATTTAITLDDTIVELHKLKRKESTTAIVLDDALVELHTLKRTVVWLTEEKAAEARAAKQRRGSDASASTTAPDVDVAYASSASSESGTETPSPTMGWSFGGMAFDRIAAAFEH